MTDQGDIGRPDVNEVQSSQKPHTGMEIPVTPDSLAVGDITKNAYDAWVKGYGLAAERAAEADRIMNSLGEISGVEIIEPGNYHDDENNVCYQYVFGTKKGEKWAQPYDNIYDEKSEIGKFIFAEDQIAFLATKGYQLVDEPREGDVAAYGFRDEKGGWNFHHAGMYLGNERVESKFSRGPAIRHPLRLVPNHYANRIAFFRKENIMPNGPKS